MSLRVVEEREKFTFSSVLDLAVWLEAFTPDELAGMALYHGDDDQLTVSYETEVFSSGERVKNLVVVAPTDPQQESPSIGLTMPEDKACARCGSTEIFFDACTDQHGNLKTVYDHSTCGGCEADCPELVEVSK